MSVLLAYALTGFLAGFLAGLLGIGGGLVIVPTLSALFVLQGFEPPLVMPFALGTSLAAIVFTSASSMLAHHRRGAVDWHIVRKMVPGIVLGALLGSAVVAYVPSGLLRQIFVAYAALTAVQMLANGEPKPARRIPGLPGMVAAGGAVGGVSMLVGIGGATISVPFMLWSNVPARVAIGTAAALGVPVALFGTIGYIGSGVLSRGLPEHALGFVYLPALVAIVAMSAISAPLGAAASHYLPVAALKRCFAGVLLVTGAQMLFA
jgi:uncharacterized membrane protein YfcA